MITKLSSLVPKLPYLAMVVGIVLVGRSQLDSRAPRRGVIHSWQETPRQLNRVRNAIGVPEGGNAADLYFQCTPASDLGHRYRESLRKTYLDFPMAKAEGCTLQNRPGPVVIAQAKEALEVGQPQRAFEMSLALIRRGQESIGRTSLLQTVLALVAAKEAAELLSQVLPRAESQARRTQWIAAMQIVRDESLVADTAAFAQRVSEGEALRIKYYGGSRHGLHPLAPEWPEMLPRELEEMAKENMAYLRLEAGDASVDELCQGVFSSHARCELQRDAFARYQFVLASLETGIGELTRANRRGARTRVDCLLPAPNWDNFVIKISETEFEVSKRFVDRLLTNPMMVVRGARIVPSTRRGKVNGFKIYAVRPMSIYAMLGFENGDTIHHFQYNGVALDLTSPDISLEVYSTLREATNFRVKLTRGGKPLTMHYTLKG